MTIFSIYCVQAYSAGLVVTWAPVHAPICLVSSSTLVYIPAALTHLSFCFSWSLC